MVDQSSLAVAGTTDAVDRPRAEQATAAARHSRL